MNNITASKIEYEKILKSNIVVFKDDNTIFEKVINMDSYFKK